MKTTIASMIRHALTALAGLGGYLSAHSLIDPADAAGVNAAGVSLADAAATIGAAVLVRVVMYCFSRFLGKGAGDGALLGLAVMCMSGFCFGLTACTSGQIESVKTIPIKATYYKQGLGTISYSSKSGLDMTVDRSSGK